MIQQKNTKTNITMTNSEIAQIILNFSNCEHQGDTLRECILLAKKLGIDAEFNDDGDNLSYNTLDALVKIANA